MDSSPPGSSIHGILQARILEWVAISFSRISSQSRDWTWVSLIARRIFTDWATRENLERHSSRVQQLAHSGWHRVNRQEDLLTGGGREGGRWWSWRGQDAISLTPDIDGTGLGSLLDSVRSTLLKKWSRDIWVVALFFLFIDDPLTLDCILNGCWNLHVPFCVWVRCLKN